MNGKLFRSVIMHAGETIGALAIVMVFFLMFMGVISLTFPEGTPLGDLMFGAGDQKSTAIHRSDVVIEMRDDNQTSLFAALLQQTRRTVLDKRAGSVAWTPARMGTQLENRHSVQTFAKASASIRFGTGSELRLDENSLIVVRKLEENRRTGKRRASMLILDGTLAGEIDPSTDDAVPIEILTASGSSLIVAESTQRSDYRVTVNPDRTSTFAVYSGTAEVLSAGEVVTLQANQTLTVREQAPPGRPETLPDRPTLTLPAHRTAVPYRAVPPRVEFRWEEQANADEYRLLIGRDPQFEDIVYDGEIEDSRFVHGNLEAGQYYWKVSGIRGWAQGASSPTWNIDVVQDVEPPPLKVDFPNKPILTDQLVLRGTTEPGAEIFIGDSSIRPETTGEFEYAMNLGRGLNVVVVEAVDAAGNIAYCSELVKAEPRIPEGTP